MQAPNLRDIILLEIADIFLPFQIVSKDSESTRIKLSKIIRYIYFFYGNTTFNFILRTRVFFVKKCKYFSSGLPV